MGDGVRLTFNDIFTDVIYVSCLLSHRLSPVWTSEASDASLRGSETNSPLGPLLFLACVTQRNPSENRCHPPLCNKCLRSKNVMSHANDVIYRK